MVKVITDRGIFEITESLYEAIKKNNPMLLERKRIKIKNHNSKKSVKQNVQQQIIDDSAKRNDNISDDIKKEVSNDVKVSIKKEKNTNTNTNANNTELTNNFNNNSDESYKDSLEYFVKYDEELHRNIVSVEALSTQIIKRIKYVIHSQAGIMGSSTSASQSNFSNLDDSDNQNIDNQNIDNKNSSKPLKNKKYINKPSEEITDNIPSSSSLFRKGTSELKLAFGGFKLEPFFGPLDSSISGKALKYYYSSIEKNDKSRIDEMIEKLIKIKSDDETIKNSDDYKKYGKEFEQMAYKFLHNVVYKLSVNNDNHYDIILRLIKYDDVLKKMFDIDYSNVQQQLNAQENILSFKNKKNNVVDLLIIASPLFAKGKKILNNLKPLWNVGKQLKV